MIRAPPQHRRAEPDAAGSGGAEGGESAAQPCIAIARAAIVRVPVIPVQVGIHHGACPSTRGMIRQRIAVRAGMTNGKRDDVVARSFSFREEGGGIIPR